MESTGTAQKMGNTTVHSTGFSILKRGGSLTSFVAYSLFRYPKSGSFIKSAQAQTGQDFMEVLRSHYFDLFNSVDNENEIVFVLKKSSVPFE